ncbi:TetR family transcriptional regulator [Rhodococcus koreensis]
MARTRRDIARAAASVFIEQGFAEASIEAIAARASVSARTVYRHFGSKGALLAAGFAVRISEFLGRLSVLVEDGGDLEESLLVALESGFLDPSEHTAGLVQAAAAEYELWGQWLWAAHRQQDVLARILCRAAGLPAEEAVTPRWRLRAGAILNAFVTAHEVWAAHSDRDLVDLLGEAVRVMAPLLAGEGKA